MLLIKIFTGVQSIKAAKLRYNMKVASEAALCYYRISCLAESLDTRMTSTNLLQLITATLTSLQVYLSGSFVLLRVKTTELTQTPTCQFTILKTTTNLPKSSSPHKLAMLISVENTIKFTENEPNMIKT